MSTRFCADTHSTKTASFKTHFTAIYYAAFVVSYPSRMLPSIPYVKMQKILMMNKTVAVKNKHFVLVYDAAGRTKDRENSYN